MSSSRYQEGKSGEGKYGGSEGKSSGDDEEFVGENVLPALMEFISGRRFRDEVSRFAVSNSNLFSSLDSYGEGKNGDSNVLELTHEHKNAFDEYQRLLEDLFEDFAKEQRTSSKKIYQCCQDTVEGKFAPLFGEDEHQYIVDQIMDFMDFDHFVKTMSKLANNGGSRK